MKLYTQNIFILGMTTLMLFTISCNSRNKTHLKESNDIAQIKKSNYELADEFLQNLKNNKTDTIIYYKRTCINCCDFFNIFWASHGKYFLRKFYANYENNNANNKTIRLSNNKVFKQLSNSFSELRKYDINNTEPYLDHYCYTQIDIFTIQDSIKTDRIPDSDFEKKEGFMPVRNDDERNEKYLANLKSKWNNLLTTIESQLANMNETPDRELNTLRINKHSD